MECSRAHASIGVVFLALFFGDIAGTMCFSYLPKLVKKFGVSEVDSAFDVGIIGASLYVGWGLSGVLWGYAGDVYGHKRVMIIASMGITCATFAFGFTRSFWWALVVRFVHGIFMGITAVGKSILTKVSDRSKVSLAFSIYYSVCTTACIFGPSFAGFMVFPAEQYPALFSKDSIFAYYCILLPNLVLALCWIVTIVLEVVVIPNDHHKEENDEEQSLIQDSEEDFETEKSCRDTDQETEEFFTERDVSKHRPITKSTTSNALTSWDNIKNLSTTRNFTTCVILYLLIGTIIGSIEEMFPVFAETSRTYHGLDLQTADVGIIFFGAGIILILFQFLIVRTVTSTLGPRRSLICASIGLMFFLPLIPIDSTVYKKTKVIGYAILVMGVIVVFINILLSQINVLISNITPSSLTGTANGIGLTANMIGNIGGPVIYGRMYSWSLQNERVSENGEHPLGFPFDHYFIFIVVSFSCLVVALVTFFSLTNEVEEINNKDDFADSDTDK